MLSDLFAPVAGSDPEVTGSGVAPSVAAGKGEKFSVQKNLH